MLCCSSGIWFVGAEKSKLNVEAIQRFNGLGLEIKMFVDGDAFVKCGSFGAVKEGVVLDEKYAGIFSVLKKKI